MKQLSWRTIIEAIGVASIVASLVFVGMELRQAQTATYSERTMSRIELLNDFRSEVNQHLDIWLKGNTGEQLSLSEEALYENLIASRTNIAFGIGVTASIAGNDLSFNPEIVAFSAFLHENPGAKAAWLRQQEQLNTNQDLIAGHDVPNGAFLVIVKRNLDILESSQ